MPNWCNTIITLNCKDKKTATHVADRIDNWTTKLTTKSDFGKSWLGNILVNSGLYTEEDIKNCKCPRCRGWIDSVISEDNQVVIQTETAWVPMMKMWKEIAENIFPNEVDEVIYSSEEWGIGDFLTNDLAFANLWFFNENGAWLEELTDDEAKQELFSLTRGKVTDEDFNNMSVSELREKVQDVLKPEDEFWYFDMWKYEYFPIESEEME